jgi:transposase InsO family protein
MNDILNDVYYNTSSPACYAGLTAVYKEAKRRNKNVKRGDVENFMHEQEVYTLHKPLLRKFTRNKTIASGKDTDWQSDLIDMQKFSSSNKGYRYILCCIDVLSRFAFAKPIKTKKPKDVRDAFKLILFESGRHPWRLYTDLGLEYYGSPFQKILKQEDIQHYSPKNQEIKCGIVERFNRTLKTRLWRLFTKRQSHLWIDELDNIIKALNNSINRTIGCKPATVTCENAQQIWDRLYENRQHQETKFSVNDLVRISKYKHVFTKSYIPTFTKECFTVSKIIERDIPVYCLKDLNGENIDGTFYSHELVKVIKTDDIYKIEEILHSRKQKGKNEYFVKWLGYPDQFNSWVDAETVVST